MSEELGAWNNGSGIDLESWVGCEGRFALTVGYSTIFWPEFVQFEQYILRASFSVASLRGFEVQEQGNRKSIEALMNHIHLDGIQHIGCKDISKDKLQLLGKVLTEIHVAKLHWQFPEKPCSVELYFPEDEDELEQYQLSFHQTG